MGLNTEKENAIYFCGYCQIDGTGNHENYCPFQPDNIEAFIRAFKKYEPTIKMLEFLKRKGEKANAY